jgi:hypothetical protein
LHDGSYWHGINEIEQQKQVSICSMEWFDEIEQQKQVSIYSMAAGKRSELFGVPVALTSRSDFLDSNGPYYLNSIAGIGLHVDNSL